MHTRRSFLKSTTLYSAGLLATPSLFARGLAEKPVIGLQLYTVRDAMGTDPAATLAKVAHIGYNSLEGATYNDGKEKFYGMDAKTFLGILKNNGLVMRSCHYRYGEDPKGATLTNGVFNGTILHDWDRAIEDAHTLGLQYMVCAWLSEPERGTLDHYKKMAANFNIAGEKCKKAGIQFCHHNHDFEFQKIDGELIYDKLMEAFDSKLVRMQFQVSVVRLGYQAADYFEKYPGRFISIHLQDWSPDQKKEVALGQGVVDWKRLFTAARQSGARNYFVETERADLGPSAKFLRGIS